jgi:WD40 repeat protein
MRLMPALVLAAALAALTAARASAGTLPVNTTAIASGDGSLVAPLGAPVAQSGVNREAVSRDGNLVVFASLSDGLSNEDNDAVDNVYVKNMTTGAITLVSRQSGAAGAPANADCFGGAISADGTRVAFTCDGPLDPADTNNDIDVYVRDLTTNETILVSRQSAAAGGAVGDGGSSSPSLSGDGNLVAFASDAHNLSNTTRRGVYVRKIAQGTTTLASVADDESLPNADSFDPSISDAGDRVAFTSDATNLVTGDDNGHDDVFVRSLQGGTTELVSKQSNAAGGKIGNGFASSPVISGNGEVVAFQSSSTNLDGRDPQSDTDVYKHDFSSNTTTLVDTTPTTKLSDGGVNPTIDDHGDAIAFASNGPISSGVNVELAEGGTVSVVHNGRPGDFFQDGDPSISGDGAHVVYRSGADEIGVDAPGIPALAMRDLPGSTVKAVSTPASGPFDNIGGQSETPVVSADGRFVAFATAAPAFGVPPDSIQQVVVRDMATGAVNLVSREDGPGGAPLAGASDDPSISADGTDVAFRQTRPDGLELVWVRDLTTGRTVLASRADGASGDTANGDSFNPSIDANGGRVAFESVATNLSPADTKTDNDVYVRDLGTNQTILASVGVNGQKGNEESRVPSLSGDGHHVAFFSSATNLGDGDTDSMSDIHVRDIDAGTTRLASVSSSGEKGDSSSEDPSISADGSRVAFDSSAGNFGVTSQVQQVWVHDFSSGSTTLVSRADGANGAVGDNGSFTPVISPDGNFIAINSEASNLTADATGGRDEIFRRDLAANTTSLASRASGSNGAPVSDFADFAGISSQGACVVFEAGGGLLGPVAGASDFEQIYLRALGPNCPGPAGGGMTPPPRDTTAPRLRRVSLTHTRFRVAKGRTSLIARTRIPRGTVLRYTVSEPARLTIVIERRRVRVHGRHRRISFVRVARLTRNGVKAGPGRVKLTGRIGKRRMAAGAYRLTLTAQDAAGNRSKPARRTFTILPG